VIPESFGAGVVALVSVPEVIASDEAEVVVLPSWVAEEVVPAPASLVAGAVALVSVPKVVVSDEVEVAVLPS